MYDVLVDLAGGYDGPDYEPAVPDAIQEWEDQAAYDALEAELEGEWAMLADEAQWQAEELARPRLSIDALAAANPDGVPY